jgi:hypothetical protein
MTKKREPRHVTFVLQFPATDIRKSAEQYSYKTDSDDEKRLMSEIGPRVKQRGYFDGADFLAACKWKSTRPARHYTKNADDDVRKVTALALATADERLRICLLTALRGVDYPMASVLLHFGATDYPILDFRAFEALGVFDVGWYTFEIWKQYTDFCRDMAKQNGVDMRTLDRALWQWSKDNPR